MRIALVHYTKPPVVGGVERVIADQAAALTGLGHEVEIVDFEGMAELERAVECRRVVGSSSADLAPSATHPPEAVTRWRIETIFPFVAASFTAIRTAPSPSAAPMRWASRRNRPCSRQRWTSSAALSGPFGK